MAATNPKDDRVYDPLTGQEEGRISTLYHDDDEEHNDNENAPLLSNPDTQSLPQSSKRKKLRLELPPPRILVPLALCLATFIFFLVSIINTNLVACMIPSPEDQSEQIRNLTTRLDKTENLLKASLRNVTSLTSNLKLERQRLEVCRETEKRLADRVEVAEAELGVCVDEKEEIEKEKEEIEEQEQQCEKDKKKLEGEIEDGVYWEFESVVQALGTGGDSWVCSDKTPAWFYGYTSDKAPHTIINIQTWTADLNDVDHGSSPLVFPPTAPSENEGVDDNYFDDQSPPRIIGYKVTSKNTSGNNGWWRITYLDKFGKGTDRIEFWALAAKWYGSKAEYEVKVWWYTP